MGQWANYFSATVSGAATLTGLIFVSVSLNLKKILSISHLPGRALGSLILLTNILISGSFCLVPGQSLFLLGLEIECLGILVWIVKIWTFFVTYRKVAKAHRGYHLQNLFFTQLAVVPYVVAGIIFLNGSDTGFYWLVAGTALSFINSLTDAWVLLVEINR